MRNSPILFVIIASIWLLILVILAQTDISFGWLFYLTISGQAFFLVVVYKVLKAPYKSNRTFDDFYQDHDVNE